jgi:hypothetical protein
MTETQHVKAFRLFDLSQPGSAHGGFKLTDWEREHLHSCPECQRVLSVFLRQFGERLPSMPTNGETNPKEGWYRNLCCGLEVFVMTDEVFPDCRRHRNLPTVWKRISDFQKKHSA